MEEMDTMNSSISPEGFIADLPARPELLARIQLLAHRPQAWIHESLLAEGLGMEQGDPMFARLRATVLDSASVRIQSDVARRFDDEYQLEPLRYELFTNRRWRLATLSLAVLSKLARAAGLFRISPAISAEIHRPAVSRIVDQIGAKAYREAIAKGPLLLGKVPPCEVTEADLANSLKNKVMQVGWQSIGTALIDAPPSIGKRVELKLSPTAAEHFLAVEDHWGNHAEAVGQFLIRVLKNHVNRKVAQCVF